MDPKMAQALAEADVGGDAFHVLLGLPNYDRRLSIPTMQAIRYATLPGGSVGRAPYFLPKSSSLLPRSFNELWARAIQSFRPKYDAMAMIHDDVTARPGWLDTLFGTMRERDADLVSACIKIKDNSRDTSTAIETGPEPGDLERLSQSDLERLPLVFDADDVRAEFDLKYRGRLLVNTGLWVCRLDRPWVRKWSGFQFRSGVSHGTDDEGKPAVHIRMVPEDWQMSRDLADLGCRILASQELNTIHYDGSTGYSLRDQVVDETGQPINAEGSEHGETGNVQAAGNLDAGSGAGTD